MRIGGIVLIVYLVIGVLVAMNQGYFQNLGNISNILEAIVAVVIWPLLLLGVDFDFGGVGGNGGNGGGGNSGGGN